MAQSEGFKHITVTPAEEDDVVIRVGATGSDGPAEEPQVEPEPDPEPVSAHQAEADEPAQSDQPVPEPTKAKPSTQKKRDDYREATLEDLKSQPMPLAQKIVIAAAVVCIIGAIVYYLLFLR